MPTYEYKCENGHVFEVIQRMSDERLTECQLCEAPVKRVFHPVPIHFKGSGFYNTDYGTRKRAREMKESGGNSSKAGSTNSGEPGKVEPGKVEPGKAKGNGESAAASPSPSSSASTAD